MVASGRVPGVRLDRWPTAQTISSASREEQVDAVIASLLGGAVSPDTRAILVTGRNPFLEANPDVVADTMMVDVDPPPMMTGAGRGGRGGRRGAGNQPLPQLDGLALIVGLALGSPEFQRR